MEFSNHHAVTALIRHGASVSVRDGRDPYDCDQNVRLLDMILPPGNVGMSESPGPTMGVNPIDLAVMQRH